MSGTIVVLIKCSDYFLAYRLLTLNVSYLKKICTSDPDKKILFIRHHLQILKKM